MFVGSCSAISMLRMRKTRRAKAIIGFADEEAMLKRLSLEVQVPEAWCCSRR